MKFKSKIDIWMHFVFIAIVASVVWIFYMNIAKFTAVGFMFACIYAAFIACFVIPIRFNIYYEITGDFLIIHCAFTEYKVQFDDIISVKNTHNPLSSPALSLDRLAITYKSRNSTDITIVSPKNKQKFIDELLSRNVLIEKL